MNARDQTADPGSSEKIKQDKCQKLHLGVSLQPRENQRERKIPKEAREKKKYLIYGRTKIIISNFFSEIRECKQESKVKYLKC